MIAAAAITPTSLPDGPLRGKPYGIKGWKCDASNTGNATAMNSASASILMTTRMALRVALSRVPAISRPATTQMMKIAGRLRTPPSSGPWISASGKAMPIDFRNPAA